jgi:hypothetical protein
MKPTFTSALLIKILITLLCCNRIHAQTFEEYKNSYEQRFQQFLDSNQKRRLEMQERYNEYIKSREEAYSQYLKDHWDPFHVNNGFEATFSPKPGAMPFYTIPERQNDTLTYIPVLSPVNIPVYAPDLPARSPLHNTHKTSITAIPVQFMFYGTDIQIYADQELTCIPAPTINEMGIARFWEQACLVDYGDLVDQLLILKNDLSLNDWGYYLLIKQMTESLDYPDINSRKLLTWFLLTRSGYRAKFSYSGQETSVIVPSNQVIYGKDYLTIDGIHYFILDAIDSNVIHTYARDYYDATRPFDFNLDKSPDFRFRPAHRIIEFTFNNESYEINLDLNENLMAFYHDYPLVDIDVYMNAAVDEEVYESLANALLPAMDLMNEVEKIDFILRFVQTAFRYQTDQEQFGKEKYFFPEEVVFYPSSDCEDRSVLFSFLVSELLHKKVIGLRYDGHMAAAVCITEGQPVDGRYIFYRNERYIITDPTYINAPAGTILPQFADALAEVIELSRVNYIQNSEIDFWGMVYQAGGCHGGNPKDMITDGSGNVFLTGYFIDSLKFETWALAGKPGHWTAFTAEFDRYGEIKWISAFPGDNVSAGFAIAFDDQENIIIAGSFEGLFHFGKFSLISKEGHPDVFIAKYDPCGNPVWAGQAGLDSIDRDLHMKYMVMFDRNGNLLSTELFDDGIEDAGNGLFVDERGQIYYSGNLNTTAGFACNERRLGDGGIPNIAEQINDEFKRLISDTVERNIASILAVLSLVKVNGMIITGHDLIKAIDSYGPDFKFKCPEFYSKLGKILRIENKNGIITILTADQESLFFGDLSIENGSQFMIPPLEGGNERIEIITGLKVGRQFIWFTLNYIQLDRKTGNLLFDYHNFHFQLEVNFGRDIIGVNS